MSQPVVACHVAVAVLVQLGGGIGVTGVGSVVARGRKESSCCALAVIPVGLEES